MRKKLLTFLLSISFVVQVSAQGVEPPAVQHRIPADETSRAVKLRAEPQQKGKWFAGLSGGMLFGDTDMSGRNFNVTNMNSFQSGLVLGYGLTEEFRIQAEFLFERRGFRSTQSITGFRLTDTSEHVCWQCYYDYDVTFISDYLHLPLLIQYGKAKGPMQISVQAGLYYSLLLINNHHGYEAFYLDPEGADPFLQQGFEPGLLKIIYSGPTTNVINTYDAGLLLGLGFGYELGQHFTIQFDGRLQVGFAGIFENPQMPVLNFKSYVVRCGFMYKFKSVNE